MYGGPRFCLSTQIPPELIGKFIGSCSASSAQPADQPAAVESTTAALPIEKQGSAVVETAPSAAPNAAAFVLAPAADIVAAQVVVNIENKGQPAANGKEKEEAAGKHSEPAPAKAGKDEFNTLFNQCKAVGEKLKGTIKKGTDIAKWIEEGDAEWKWGTTDLEDLKTMVAKHSVLETESSKKIGVSTAVHLKATEKDALNWLTKHKSDLVVAFAEVDLMVSNMVRQKLVRSSMHANVKPAEAKRRKRETK